MTTFERTLRSILAYFTRKLTVSSPTLTRVDDISVWTISGLGYLNSGNLNITVKESGEEVYPHINKTDDTVTLTFKGLTDAQLAAGTFTATLIG